MVYIVFFSFLLIKLKLQVNNIKRNKRKLYIIHFYVLFYKNFVCELEK